MRNPFTLTELKNNEDFCNRKKEINLLKNLAMSANNAVILSDRRFGKSSLVKRVQNEIAGKAITVYCDISAVSGIDNFCEKLSYSILESIRNRESLFKKAATFFFAYKPVLQYDAVTAGYSLSLLKTGNKKGLELLTETLGALKKTVENSELPVNIAFDEFQDITDIKDAEQAEAILRSVLQSVSASFFFIGSKKSIMQDIFTNKKRPFYKSADIIALEKLPIDEFAQYVADKFNSQKKQCSVENAYYLINKVDNMPFYVQLLGLHTYINTEYDVTKQIIDETFAELLESYRYYFGKIIESIPPKQREAFIALAKNPTDEPYSAAYLQKHSITLKTMQNTIKNQEKEGYLENCCGMWKLNDKVLAEYIMKYC